MNIFVKDLQSGDHFTADFVLWTFTEFRDGVGYARRYTAEGTSEFQILQSTRAFSVSSRIRFHPISLPLSR